MMHLLKNPHGFTLVELLVAMVIGMLVASGAYSVFFSTTRTARKQEQVSEIQQNLRVAMERISQDIRQAGFGLPEDGSPLSYATGESTTSGTWSAPITTSNSTSAPDQITLLGIGYKIGMTSGYSGGSLMINPDFNGDDQFSGYMETRYVNESPDETGSLKDPNADGGYFDKFMSSGSPRSYRRHLSIGGVEYAEATYNTVNNNVIIVGGVDNDDYAENIPVFFIQAITYLVDNDCYDDDDIVFPCLKSRDSTLLRGSGTQVVAEGIEDIQFAYGVDVSPRDGKIDYSASGYNSAAFESDPADDSSIVAVRVSIVARSKVPDQNDSSARPALEDRPAGTTDRYVRRTLTKTIKLRNPRSGA